MKNDSIRKKTEQDLMYVNMIGEHEENSFTRKPKRKKQTRQTDPSVPRFPVPSSPPQAKCSILSVTFVEQR